MFEAVLYGVGIILGAGIYALIGVGAGIAGNALWISFVVGAVIAAFTGFSYAELSSMYPKEAAEYVYTKHALGKEALAPFLPDTAEKILAQIRAWDEAAAPNPEFNGGWMLWNPSNIYTKEALQNEPITNNQ